MTDRWKTVFAGEWVWVRRMLNKRFPAGPTCKICQRSSCGMAWYSIRTKEVRCPKCFDAIAEDLRIRDEIWDAAIQVRKGQRRIRELQVTLGIADHK